jgi:BMFP domain-containing protein YqiC
MEAGDPAVDQGARVAALQARVRELEDRLADVLEATD